MVYYNSFQKSKKAKVQSYLLSLEFLGEMAKAVSAMKTAGYEPYDQLYGYVLHGNDQYITRFGGARDFVTKMDDSDIRTFLKHYKEHR